MIYRQYKRHCFFAGERSRTVAAFSQNGRRNAYVRPPLVPHFVYGSFPAVFCILNFGYCFGSRPGYDFPNRNGITYGKRMRDIFYILNLVTRRAGAS